MWLNRSLSLQQGFSSSSKKVYSTQFEKWLESFANNLLTGLQRTCSSKMGRRLHSSTNAQLRVLRYLLGMSQLSNYNVAICRDRAVFTSLGSLSTSQSIGHHNLQMWWSQLLERIERIVPKVGRSRQLQTRSQMWWEWHTTLSRQIVVKLQLENVNLQVEGVSTPRRHSQ